MKIQVPEVSTPVWKELYAAAARFRALQPWEVLDDFDLIGVRDSTTGETGYGVVMGSGGTLSGFVLYRGSEGFELYRRLISGERNAQAGDYFAIQNCLMVELGPKRGLHPEDLAVIRRLGLAIKGTKAWPQFRSLIPGYAPWFLTEAEATFLTLALEVAIHHCERVEREEVQESLRDTECLVYSPTAASENRFNARWEPWPRPPELRPPVLNLARINTILAKKPKADSPWEADTFYLPSTILDRDRPYYARLAAVCRQSSGFAFTGDVILPEISTSQALADAICKSVEQHGFLPDTLFVRDEEVATLLASLGKALGITVRHRKDLKCIELLKSVFEEQTMPGAVFRKKGRGVPAGRTVYQMKVTLRGSKPRIWRRFLVPADYTLEKLHHVLQIVMGWENYHLYEFIVGEHSYGKHYPEFGDRMLNDRKVTLQEIAPERGMKFTYIYDFGDDWQHELKLEKILLAKEGEQYPRCVEGERACPPEDCGGIWGFAELLEAIKNPATEDQRELVEWAGRYNPDVFDIEAINKRLRKMR